MERGGPQWEMEGGGAMAMMKNKYGPPLGMVYVQVAYAAMFLVARFALTRGMNHYAFVLYRQVIAAMAICPLAYFLNRNQRLTIRWKNVTQIFLLALIGTSICQNFYYSGLALTSSTFASTMNNLQPAVTFLLAYLLRLEEVRIKSRGGQAKILGTLLCVAGAMVMTFFQDHNQGQGLHAQIVPFPLPEDLGLLVQVGGGSFILGAFLTIIGSWSWSAFLIYQAWVVEEYSSPLALSGLVSLMGSLQVAVIALVLEKPAALRLQWDLQLLVTVYSGIFCSGFGVFTTMWCVKEKGPVYVTALNPLSTVMVVTIEPFLLHVQLGWSSLTGMAMVIAGLYLFLWGKAQDGKAGKSSTATRYSDGKGEGNANDTSINEESSNQEPLLAKGNL